MRLLIFTSPNCPGCRNAPELIRALEGKLAAEKVDVATPGGEALAARYRVFGVPAAILIGEGGAPLRDWRWLPEVAEVLEEVRTR